MHPSRGFTKSGLARVAGVHRHTLRKQAEADGLDLGFSDISNDELRALAIDFETERPTSGIKFFIAYLRNRGVRVQNKRAIEALSYLKRLNRRIVTQRIKRRQYVVPGYNYVWHLDGHHKLNRYKIVIHGLIDGFCRTVSHEAL